MAKRTTRLANLLANLESDSRIRWQNEQTLVTVLEEKFIRSSWMLKTNTWYALENFLHFLPRNYIFNLRNLFRILPKYRLFNAYERVRALMPLPSIKRRAFGLHVVFEWLIHNWTNGKNRHPLADFQTWKMTTLPTFAKPSSGIESNCKSIR